MTNNFGAKSTTDDILDGIDLTGKRYLVTGVSSGIGLETARALVSRGAKVVGTARNIKKARLTVEQAAFEVELLAVDLADLKSVRAAANKLVGDGLQFDGVIANAGVMATPFGRTPDGFETQFGTNHLGHFVLVNRVASLIRSGGRLVTVSSNGHRWADVDLDDPNFEHRPYDPWVSYGGSKTAVILFAVEFDRRYRDRDIRATSLMPGVSQTNLARHLSQDDLAALGARIAAELATAGQTFEFKTIPQVAATSVWAAVVAEGEAIGGRYCQDCEVARIDDTPGIREGAMSYALDPERAKALWAKSEELVGERF